MDLSTELVREFAKTAKSDTTSKGETILYGTVVKYNGSEYVRLDGSDQLTPISSAVVSRDGDRVMVLIKNHSATAIGNTTSPSASDKDVQDMGTKITEVQILIANKVDTIELDAERARIDELEAQNVTITGSLDAAEADIDELKAKNVTIEETLTAQDATIQNLEAKKLDAEIADITYATISELEATNATVHNLQADYGEFKSLTTDKFTATDATITRLDTEKLSAEEAELKYANIDFANIGMAAVEQLFTKAGIIGDLVVGDQHITGKLVGVTIVGDLIEGGTVKADKLVIKGMDGLYYKLNTNGTIVSSEQTEYNSLNGAILTAKSVTAEKVNVHDLVAFGATIGGFNITEDAIYSGAKNSADNSTRGVYMGDDGQFSVGDSINFLKYYRASDGSYKLDISAESIKLGTSGKTVEEELTGIKETVDNIEIGGRNLVQNSNNGGAGWSNTSYSITSSVYLTPYASDKIGSNGHPILVEGETYTISVKAKIMTGTGVAWFAAYWGGSIEFAHWTPVFDQDHIYTKTFTANHTHSSGILDALNLYIGPDSATRGTNTIYWIKIEKGNKSTDWTPAPEDMATQEEVNNAQESANNVQAIADNTAARLELAESSVELLKNSISMLVTDENGNSMMTQTSNGWTFNMSSIEKTLEDTVETLNGLSGEIDGVDTLLSNVNEIVDGLSKKTAYISMETDSSGSPVIELGKSDNEFKLRITNKSVDFMEGTSRIAYISNKALYIERAVIKDELQIGDGEGFIWKRRSNGNMGLRWIGGGN